MADEDFKHWPRKTASDKILHDKIFDIAKNPKYDGYKRGLAGANASGGAVTSARSETVDRQCKSVIENKITSNQELAKSYTNRFLQNLKNEKYNNLLKTIIGALIFRISNW